MRSIKQVLFNRMILQADEVEIQGLTKVAKNLTNQLQDLEAVRDNQEFYSYAESEFQQDVEDYLWKIIIRTADFHDCNFDALEMQTLVEKFANEMQQQLGHQMHFTPGVGAYEPNLPGETKFHTILEVEECNK